jgi:hypothetical protein
MQFDMMGGFSRFRHSENVIDAQKHNLHIPIRFDDSEDEGNMNRSDFSSSMAKRYSFFGSKAPSVRKIKFTDRTAPENEKRIIVSEDCQNRIQSFVETLANKKRREAQDWKIRENIMRKIDEKYGELAI